MATIENSADVTRRVFHGQTIDSDIKDSIIERTIEVLLPEDAAAADATNYILFEAKDKNWALQSAALIPCAVITEHAANYATLDLNKEDGAAGGLVSLDSTNTLAGAGGTMAARVPRDFTIVPATDTLAPGEILVLEVTKAALGVIVEDTLFRATLHCTD